MPPSFYQNGKSWQPFLSLECVIEIKAHTIWGVAKLIDKILNSRHKNGYKFLPFSSFTCSTVVYSEVPTNASVKEMVSPS